jgi:hypothetical protein
MDKRVLYRVFITSFLEGYLVILLILWSYCEYKTTKLSSPVLIPKKQLESNESEFEGFGGAKNPTPD